MAIGSSGRRMTGAMPSPACAAAARRPTGPRWPRTPPSRDRPDEPRRRASDADAESARPFAAVSRPCAERWHWWRAIRSFPSAADGLGRSPSTTSAEPADIWHGMWAGSLPALDRLRRRHGGRTIYDSRDVYMQSRELRPARPPGRYLLESARAALGARGRPGADRQRRLRRPARPAAPGPATAGRHELPGAWTPPSPPPDLIRAALGPARRHRGRAVPGQS